MTVPTAPPAGETIAMVLGNIVAATTAVPISGIVERVSYGVNNGNNSIH